MFSGAVGAEADAKTAELASVGVANAAPRAQALLRGLDKVAAFPPGRAYALLLDPPTLAAAADAEAGAGMVALGPRGLSPGERLHVIQPARHLVSEWRTARSAFDVAIEPFMPALAAAAPTGLFSCV